jgi:hypothetical protein
MEQINNLSKLVNKNKKLSWTIFIAYIAIFVGCAGFPLFPQYAGYTNIILHLVNAVYIVPLMLVALLGKDKVIKTYSVSFISLLLGMICRYFIEFGEVSNSVNFTVINIVSFLAILPLVYMATYYLYSKKLN